MVFPLHTARGQFAHQPSPSRSAEPARQVPQPAKVPPIQQQQRLSLLALLHQIDVSCSPQALETDTHLLNVPVGAELPHAEPAPPLRQQDIQALKVLFDRDDIRDIEANVHQRLSELYPEPCWDEEPYAFLHDYL